MANSNPIRPFNPNGYMDFLLPAGAAAETLFISTAVRLDPAGSWKYSEMNEVSIDGEPCYDTPTKPVTHFEAGRISALTGVAISVRTRLLLAYVNEKAAQQGLPETIYTVSFFIGDTLFERHELRVSHDAPKFYTKIIIRLQA